MTYNRRTSISGTTMVLAVLLGGSLLGSHIVAKQTAGPAAVRGATGVVQGMVTRIGSAEPLAGVEITLAAGALPDSLVVPGVPTRFSQSMSDGYARRNAPQGIGPLTTTTDGSGQFVFNEIPRGEYSVRAQRDGYFGYAGTNHDYVASAVSAKVVVVEDRPTPAVLLSLAPGGSVSGLVQDVDGRPVSGATVAAYQLGYREDGRAMLVGANALFRQYTAKTNELGEYRLFWLTPGDYYVGASFPPTGLRGAPPVAHVRTEDAFVRTFFPSLLDPRTGPPLTIGAAAQFDSINITIQTTPKFKISGRVIATGRKQSPQPNMPYVLTLSPVVTDTLIDDASEQFRNAAADQSDGKFEIENVRPGSYYLTVMPNGFPSEHLSGGTRVDVGDEDVKNAMVVVDATTVRVRGRLLMEGAAVNPAGKITMRLFPLDRDATSAQGLYQLTADVGADGTFVLENVSKGKYRVTGFLPSFGLPVSLPNAYIADVRLGGASVYHSGLTIAGELQGELEVVVRTDGGTISNSFETRKWRALTLWVKPSCVSERC